MIALTPTELLMEGHSTSLRCCLAFLIVDECYRDVTVTVSVLLELMGVMKSFSEGFHD